ncbi:MAG: cation diffusion facilitator family transporter [Vicinamibacterales bacterium]
MAAHAHTHAHDDHHDHDHHGHSHAVSADADRRYLTVALMLIVAFMVVEIVVGILAHSLALLSDAAHMLTDAGALALSLFVIRFVERPSGAGYTYGRRRAEVLSGHANGSVLLVLAALITYESISRLIHPPAVAGLPMTIVAAAGVAVNIAAAWTLAKANRGSLNVEGSFQHILTDLYAFIGTAIAGVVIIVTGIDRVDAIASLIVAGLMFRSGFQLQRTSLRVLLEAAPEGVAPAEVGWAMAHGAHVKEVHDLHLWEIAPGHPILTAHVLVEPDADCHGVRRDLEQLLKDRFCIDHTTLQVEHAHEEFLTIGRAPADCETRH